MKPLFETTASIHEYIRKNRILLIVLFLFLLLFYWAWLACANVSLDTEYLINHPDSDYNWLSSGRFGLLFSRWLLGLTSFNPYFQNLIFLLCLWTFTLIMGWLLHWLGEIRSPLVIFLFMASISKKVLDWLWITITKLAVTTGKVLSCFCMMIKTMQKKA